MPRYHGFYNPESRITGFFIPAPSYGSEDWPTTDNQVTVGVACSHQSEDEILFDDQEKQSEGRTDDQEGVHQDRDDQEHNRGGSEITRQPADITIRCSPTAPSSGDVEKPDVSDVIVRGTTMYVGNEGTTKEASMNENMRKECNFKRGGMCTTHGCVGEKFQVSKSVWTKKKDGTYGYKQTKQTKYRCRYKGVTNSNNGIPETELGKKTTDISSLGEGFECQLLGDNTLPGISGEINTGAGATESESLKDYSRTQDYG